MLRFSVDVSSPSEPQKNEDGSTTVTGARATFFLVDEDGNRALLGDAFVTLTESVEDGREIVMDAGLYPGEGKTGVGNSWLIAKNEMIPRLFVDLKPPASY